LDGQRDSGRSQGAAAEKANAVPARCPSILFCPDWRLRSARSIILRYGFVVAFNLSRPPVSRLH
jgi:hypothetical protein